MRFTFLAALIAMSFVAAAPSQAESTDGHVMKHSDHNQHMGAGKTAEIIMPTEGGQAGFTTIAEIVQLLNQDPNTDWSKVDISALRKHLVDMSELTLRAAVETSFKGNQVVFQVTGEGRTLRAIQAMVPAHASVLTAENLFEVEAETIENGAIMRVTFSNDHTMQQIKALGFFGIMATGAHHQEHHLQMAKGGGHIH